MMTESILTQRNWFLKTDSWFFMGSIFKQHGPPKRRYSTTSIHVVTTEKTTWI